MTTATPAEHAAGSNIVVRFGRDLTPIPGDRGGYTYEGAQITEADVERTLANDPDFTWQDDGDHTCGDGGSLFVQEAQCDADLPDDPWTNFYCVSLTEKRVDIT